MVAQFASRALGLVIAKFKAYGDMSFKCFTKLYDSMVLPNINYGSSMPGAHEFSCISSMQYDAR